MVMFSEDVTALDFDDDDDNEGGGRSGGDGDEVEVGDDDDDYASLYPSSPELGAGTSANFLRDQVHFTPHFNISLYYIYTTPLT